MLAPDPPDFLFDGPDDHPKSTIVLAHGAGAPMDSPFMAVLAGDLASRGHRVARFEFPYMRTRHAKGGRRPPDRAPVLLDCWRAAVAALGGGPGLVIGGKSMGGRMAGLVADETGARGLVCLGFPFHAAGKPPAGLIGHLAALRTPTLIVQGTREPWAGPKRSRATPCRRRSASAGPRTAIIPWCRANPRAATSASRGATRRRKSAVLSRFCRPPRRESRPANPAFNEKFIEISDSLPGSSELGRGRTYRTPGSIARA